MIIWGNAISTNTSRPDYAETNEALASFIKNKPDAAIKKAQDTADQANTAAGKAQTAAEKAQTAADSKVAQITAEVVLTASGWSGERQTVTVEGVTTINTVFIAPVPASIEPFGYYEITCVKQGNGNLTFSCEGEPDTDITLNVVILDVTVSPESGNPAVPGEDGGYYIPRVTQIDATTVRFEFTPSETDMPAVDPVTVTLPAGTGGGGSADLTGYATEAWVQAGYQPKGNYALASQIPSVPVQSVNGKTGAVKLNAADVGADSTGTASSAVSGHNVSTDAHNDIRLELQKINAKLTAFFNSDDQTLDELSEIVAYITSNKSLIDAITTSKVSVLDIVNDLVTNVPAKPLSAAQGVVLKTLIDNLSTGKLDASKLTEAINTALAQAKASGEFNGKDGVDGKDGYNPVKGVDYFDGQPGKDGSAGQRGPGILNVTTAPTSYTTATGGKNPIKRMAIATIKSQSGATEVLVGDQIAYSYYHYHVYYLDATYAYMDTSQSIRGATGAAGAAGKTAYQYAQDGGFTGSEAEFTEGLASVDDFRDLTIEVTTTSRTININPGGYEYGTFKSSGGAETNLSPKELSFRSADYIPIQGGKSVMFWFDRAAWNNDNPGSMPVKMVEYDSNKNFIQIQASCKPYIVTAKPTYELNANTAYIRIAIDNYTSGAIANFPLEDIKIGIYYSENITEAYVEYEVVKTQTMIRGDRVSSGGASLFGKKIVYDGDSICDGYASGGGYGEIIASLCGCTSINQAVGGARLASMSDRHSVVDNIVNLPTDGDLYCFQGGINDWWANTQLGTFSQGDYTGTVDPATIYGAMETIFRYALTNFVGKPICFVITHKIQNNAYSKNTNGHTFWDYRKAMIDVCEKYSVPYYDAFTKSGLNGWNDAQNNTYLTGNSSGTGDGIHPNTDGYKRYYVPQLIELFRQIMPVG